VEELDPRKGAEMTQVLPNTLAPDFELADFTGKLVRLSDFRGRTHVLLIFNRSFL
jgi:peroxiredoxin